VNFTFKPNMSLPPGLPTPPSAQPELSFADLTVGLVVELLYSDPSQTEWYPATVQQVEASRANFLYDIDGECEWVTEANAAGRLRMTLHAANTLLMEQYASLDAEAVRLPSRPRHKQGWRTLPSSPRPLARLKPWPWTGGAMP
jgi:hypothetical protein